MNEEWYCITEVGDKGDLALISWSQDIFRKLIFGQILDSNIFISHISHRGTF